MITKFTLNDQVDDVEEFQEPFVALADTLSRVDGFVASRLGRSKRASDVFYNLGHWADAASYQAAVADRDFFVHLSELYYLASIESDQAAAVSEAGDADGHGVIALTVFTLREGVDAADFERRFHEHVEFVVAQPGFVHHRFLRSLRRPGVYVNVGTWASAEEYLTLVRSPEFGAEAARMAPLVSVESDFVAPLEAGVAG